MGREEIQPREGQSWFQDAELQKQPRGPAQSTEPKEIVLSLASEAFLGLMLGRGVEKEVEESVQPTSGRSISQERLTYIFV